MTETGTAFTSKAPRMGMVPSLDGFRGLGVTMLLIGHALFGYVESWVTVIDAFFVLSGFLITTLLIQEHDRTGTIGLRAFYWRRGLRLFPSVWLFVGVWLAIGLVFQALTWVGVNLPDGIPTLGDIAADGAAAVGYVYHLFFPNGLYVIEPAVQEQRTMWHLWTLGIEEWFYLGIAGTVLICVKKSWMKQLGVLLAVTFIATAIARWFSYTGFFQDDENMIAGVRMFLLQRPDSLMLGVLVAIVNAYLPERFTDGHRRPLLWLGTLGLGLWLLMLNLSSGAVQKLGGPYFEYLPAGPEEFNRADMMATTYWFRFGHTLGALGFAFVLICLARYRTWWVGRGASAGWLQWMGQRSYTIYIWHALPFVFIMGLTGGEDAALPVQLIRMPIMAAVAIGISVVVYNKVEMRVLRSNLKATGDRMSKSAVEAAKANRESAQPGEPADDKPADDKPADDKPADDKTADVAPQPAAVGADPDRPASNGAASNGSGPDEPAVDLRDSAGSDAVDRPGADNPPRN